MMNRTKTIVVTPTYNERENIEQLIEGLFALDIGLEVLVVDDHSPDGTAKAVEAMSHRYPGVHLLRRFENPGRGAASLAGLQRAIEMGAELVVEMDSDLSHDPRYVPALLEAIGHYDLVLGSRFVPGGKDADRGPLRQWVTRLAGIYIRGLLGLRVADVTSGFRCYRRQVLEAIDLPSFISIGPSELLESLLKASRAGFSVGEVPIEFVDRKRGSSKLNFGLLLGYLLMVLRFLFRFGRCARRG